jgi:RHS repeat-associated protein
METGTVAVGHPVDVASGAVFTIAHDFDLPGTLPLSWRRHYATASATRKWLGPRWSTPFFVTVERDSDGYRLNTDEGSVVTFPLEKEPEPSGPILNVAATMELTARAGRITILHWHNGDDDIFRMLFEPDGEGHFRLSAYENLAGHRITVTYDAAGRPTGLHQELENRRVQLRYDAANRVTQVSVLDAQRGAVPMARYEYAGGNLSAATNAAGATTRYEYDSEGRLIAEIGELGAVFRFTYDKDGRCVHTTGDGRYMERYLRYDRVRRATAVTNSLGEVTTYFSNLTGQVLQVVEPTGGVTTREFDEFGRITAVRFPDGGEKRCTYDEGGNRAAITDPLGNTTSFVYNEQHQPIQITRPDGGVTRMEYDDRGCLIALENALGTRWEYRRDERHLVTSAISPTGLVLRKSYGPDLRWYEVSDNLGLLRRVEFDGFGNPTTVRDGEKLLRQYQCDPQGRVLQIELVGGRTMRFSWNAMDQLTARVGASGERDVWEYDFFGQLRGQVNAAGDRESLEYDTEGRLTGVRNRAGETTSFVYDATGNVSQEETFDGRVLRFEHNPAGYPVRVIDADGRWIAHQFDAAGQMVVRETSDGLRQEYGYDTEGRLTAARTGVNEVLLKRDILGRVVEEHQGTWVIESVWDLEGRRVIRRIRGRPEFDLATAYDVRGRPTVVRNNTRSVLETEWDTIDRRVRRTALETVSERMTYDFADRLVMQETAVAQGVAFSRRYRWDASDRVIHKSDSRTGQFEYVHDALGRLTAVVQDGRVQESYDYDPNGTILATHRGRREVAPGGRTLGLEDRRQEYGSHGAVVAIRGAGWEMRLEYNGELQLRESTDSRGTHVHYEYDGFGRRTAKVVNGDRREFLWDGCELVGEATGDTLDLVVFQENMEPRVLWWHGTPFTLISDATGIGHELVGVNGQVQWLARFTAYGELADGQGEPASPFRFRGQYFDHETGFAYNLRRYYDPATQCFLTPDPLGVEAGANPYEYPRNPIDWDDPFGLRCTNRHREKMAERRMDKYYKDRGYKRITLPPTSRSRTQGVDAVYYKKDGNPRYIIAEAKYGTNDLHTTTHSGEQMSNKWINTGVGDVPSTAPSRLDEAVGPARAQTIRDASANGLVERHVFYAPEGEPRTVVGAPYTGSGPGSQNPTAGPFTPVPD